MTTGETSESKAQRRCQQCDVSIEHLSVRAMYCRAHCSDRARRIRQRTAGVRTYELKGYPATVPRRWKYKPGHRFGALVVTERLGKAQGSTWVLARCDCGSERRYSLTNLVSGVTARCAEQAAHPHREKSEGIPRPPDLGDV
jgi:hypothetical protein